MMSIRGNVNGYETGCQPFEPDANRRKWSTEWSFYLATITQGFSVWQFYSSYFISQGGVYFLIPYIISMFLFIVPVIFIQTSLGQFSSTGYISVFRIAPLFKGIGYVTLFLNISCAVIFGVCSSYPLIYFLLSIASGFPWLTCNNPWNSPNCSELVRNHEIVYEKPWDYDIHKTWSTTEYMNKVILNDMQNPETRISNYILASTFLVWILTAIVLFNGVKSFGKAILFTGSIPLMSLMILLVRSLFLSNTGKTYEKLFLPDTNALSTIKFWMQTSLSIIPSLETGWGSLLTLASFNDFKANSPRYSLSISGYHILITIFGSIFSYLVHESANGRLIFQPFHNYDHRVKHFYVPYPYFFETLEVPRLWMVIFYLMLFLIDFNKVIILVFTTLMALFDEFKILRKFKRSMTVGACIFLFLASIVFTTNNMHDFFEMLSHYAVLTRIGICLIELFVILWIYGWLRFQRDIQFMLSQRIASWIFFVIRFVTPLFMLYYLYCVVAMLTNSFDSFDFDVPYWCRIITYLVKLVPWIFIPGYIVFKLIITSGSIILRLKRCVRPTDWYPIDPRNRQKYQDILDAGNESQQLTEIHCDFEEEFYDY